MSGVPAVAASLPSRNFTPRFFAFNDWSEHLHFAYDLVAQLKPDVIVELGTDRGQGYFAFCQAALENRTSSRCYAINTWNGDECFDDSTFDEISAHNQRNYWSFSQLLRNSFDESLPFFGDHSIDLLHLDGLASENIVRETLDRWLPKLRQGGILLLHDVLERRHGFGVWMVWGELFAQGKSYTFEDGSGLGVWQKPRAWATPPLLRALFTDCPEQKILADYYSDRADELRSRLAEHWQDGTIRETPAGRQTTIQVFIPVASAHREQDSVRTRIGHDEWKEVVLPLPANSCNGPLRIDFESALTVIDLAAIELTEEADATAIYYHAASPVLFDAITISGDARRLAHAIYLRVEITGANPQLRLPPPKHTGSHPALRLRIRLRVSSDIVPD